MKRRYLLIAVVALCGGGLWAVSTNHHGERSASNTGILTTSSSTTSVPTTTTQPVAQSANGSRDTSWEPVAIPVVNPPTASGVLNGKVVGIDPGHNGMNYSETSLINQLIWNGSGNESCDTTGTETNDGYAEAQFNFNVAQYLAADLQAEGAKVVLTRSSNSGVGPCIDQRATMLNNAGANVSIDIHADGGPPSGRGFTVLEPVADGPNNAVIGSSAQFGADLVAAFQATGMPLSNYDGSNGVAQRNDLAGLNLTTQPKVLIETGNMRNGTDASMLESPVFQQSAAAAMAQAITTFLTQ